MLDDGWTVPRCVDACATGALRFGDEDEFAEEIAAAEQLDPKSSVYYLNLPKKWVAGQVYDGINDNVVIGAKVTLTAADGTELATETDDFGDFWFKQIEGGAYHVKVETNRHVAREFDVDCTDEDVNMGAIPVYTLDFK